jgi:NADPH:quinone reductase-like Zn-dependent oxidoreductase
VKAAVLTGSGVEIRDVPRPTPKPTDVLVRVRACGLNRADLTMMAGHRHGSMGGAGSVAGMEFAGEVVEVGAEAKEVRPGDRVMCAGQAAFAEYAIADYGRTTGIPDAMSFEQAACLPVGLATMHDAIMTNGRLRAGECVLIQGASTGVGILGLQIAKLKGARIVIGTSTREDKRQRLKEFGADLVFDSRDPKWADQVIEATGGGVELIVDMLSGYVANQNLHATKVLGRIINIGRLGGMTSEFDYDTHSRKRIHYIGASFRTRSIEEIREITRLFRADLWDAVLDGRLRIPIDRTFALDAIADAAAHARANDHFGKIVVLA